MSISSKIEELGEVLDQLNEVVVEKGGEASTTGFRGLVEAVEELPEGSCVPCTKYGAVLVYPEVNAEWTQEFGGNCTVEVANPTTFADWLETYPPRDWGDGARLNFDYEELWDEETGESTGEYAWITWVGDPETGESETLAYTTEDMTTLVGLSVEIDNPEMSWAYFEMRESMAVGGDPVWVPALEGEFANFTQLNEYTIGGETYLDKQIKGCAFGTEINAAPNSFFRYKANFDTLDLTYAPEGLTIGNYFLQGTSLNSSVDWSKVVSVGNCFLDGCQEYNQPVNMPNLRTMGTNFLSQCETFNSTVSVPQITSLPGAFMQSCYRFNQLPITGQLTSIGDFVLSYTNDFNQPIDTSHVTAFGANFLESCTSFNQPISLESAQTIGNQFLHNATAFNQDLTIPASVQSIGTGFLQDASSMVSAVTVNAPATVAARDNWTFAATYSTAAMYTQGVAIIGQYADEWMSRFPNRTYRPFRNLKKGGPILSPESLLVAEGNTMQLELTWVPTSIAEPGTWTSSNPSAVTVDQTGAVTAVGGGSATITFTSEHYSVSSTVTGAESEKHSSRYGMVQVYPTTVYGWDIQSGMGYTMNYCVVKFANQNKTISYFNSVSLLGNPWFSYKASAGIWSLTDGMSSGVVAQFTTEELLSELGLDVKIFGDPSYHSISFALERAYMPVGRTVWLELTSENDFWELNAHEGATLWNLAGVEIRPSQIAGFSFGTEIPATRNGEPVDRLYSFLVGCRSLETVDWTYLQSAIDVGFGFLQGCWVFNSPLDWTKIKTIGTKFLQDCYSFNQPVDLSGLTTTSPYFLYGCGSFNQSIVLPDSVLLSNVFLANCYSFNQPIDLSRIQIIGDSFLDNCELYNQPIDIPNVTTVGGRFLSNGKKFNSRILAPNLTQVGQSFLYGCSEFNQPIDISKITSAGQSFMRDCSKFNQPVTLSTSLSRLENGFFLDNTSFNQDITIPASVTYVDWHVLSGMNNMTSTVYCEADPNNITFADNGSSRVLYSRTQDTPNYTTGITLAGTYAQAWKEALPDSTTFPYRKLILAS